MALCRLLRLDFTDSIGRFDERGAERYDAYDLERAAIYAEDLLESGLLRDPIDDFDLPQFAGWCRQRLAVIEQEA